jgi:nucleoid DNA-binding protein
MDTTDLTDALAGCQGMRKRAARDAVRGLTEAIADALVRGEVVRLTGLGTLRPVARVARTYTLHGVAKEAPARVSVKFRASKALKDRLPAAVGA